eukprot:3170649-Prymnesium_polylepis.1
MRKYQIRTHTGLRCARHRHRCGPTRAHECHGQHTTPASRTNPPVGTTFAVCSRAFRAEKR